MRLRSMHRSFPPICHLTGWLDLSSAGPPGDALWQSSLGQSDGIQLVTTAGQVQCHFCEVSSFFAIAASPLFSSSFRVPDSPLLAFKGSSAFLPSLRLLFLARHCVTPCVTRGRRSHRRRSTLLLSRFLARRPTHYTQPAFAFDHQRLQSGMARTKQTARKSTSGKACPLARLPLQPPPLVVSRSPIAAPNHHSA